MGSVLFCFYENIQKGRLQKIKKANNTKMDIPLWLQIVLQLLLQFFLIMLNAIFACAEIAVIEIKGAKLEKIAENGNKRAKRLLKLTENPAKFLATIQVAITLSGFLASAFAAENFSVYIVEWLGTAPDGSGLKLASNAVIDTVSVIVITLILSYITLIFGELVPKRLAMKNPEKVALGLSGIVNFVAKTFKPLVWLLTVSTNGVLRLLKIDPNADESDVSEEDIRMMADAGTEMGIIDEEENEIIQNVFEFDDKTVGEIATHRTEMVVLWEEDGDADWENTIADKIFSYYPICTDNLDNITGILNAEKYLRLKDRSRKNVLEKAVIKPKFVTEKMKADVLFREMKRSNDGSTIAVVVDEYGGTHGVITLTDLLEEIVGDLDETDAEQDAVPSGEGYILSGQAERRELDDLFDIDTDSESSTVGGWIMEKLEKIPETGDELEADGIKVKVTKADDKKIIELYVEKLTDEDTEEEEVNAEELDKDEE